MKNAIAELVAVKQHRRRRRRIVVVETRMLLLLAVLLSTTAVIAAATEEEGGTTTNATTPGSKNLNRCISPEEFDETVDYFPDKFSPREYDLKQPADLFEDNKAVFDNTTDLFTITYHNYYKIVTNKFVNQTYLLYQCGATPPAAELDGRHHLVLPIPHVDGIAVTETPQIPPMELLGKRRDVIAYIGDPIYVSSPCIKYMMEDEQSIEVYFDPDDPFNDTKTAAMRADFINKHPDAIIFGGPYADSTADRVVSLAASQERTTVATFDWIGYYAAFFNLEAVSNDIAAATQERFECSSSNAAALSADVAASDKPVVLWAQYFTGYNWSVAECPVWDAAYYCEYAQHCGANILSRPDGVGWNNPDYGGNFWYLNDDELLQLGKDADIWVYPSKTWDTVYGEKKDLLDQFKSVQNKQVYDTQGQGPHAWHEQRLAEYDVVALDFCDLVGMSNPAATTPHNRRWFRNIFTEPVGSLDACNVPTEIDEPYRPAGAQCTPIVLSVESSTAAAHVLAGNLSILAVAVSTAAMVLLCVSL